jgi:hypothetical protein
LCADLLDQPLQLVRAGPCQGRNTGGCAPLNRYTPSRNSM